jgi:thiosulfate/3-mercaptopyruvate sulfurtransferase
MPNRLSILLGAACLSVATGARAAEYPLANGKISVAYGTPGKQRIKLSGRWQGSLAGTSPILSGATLRVFGAYGEGGTAVIPLAAAAWRTLPNDRGWKYVDSTGAAGGIRSIVLKNGRNGKPGTLKVAGSKASVAYDHRATHTRVRASLEIGVDRWCALADAPKDAKGRITGVGTVAPASCPADIVVDAAWLRARLGSDDVQVIDARAAFTGGHVPGALPLRPEHLATTIGGIILEVMPPAQAETVLSGIGLRRDATVVVYGAPPEYDPARVVWTLHYLGHPDVRYLDGGFAAWVAGGGTVAAGSPVAGAPSGYAIDAVRPDDIVTGAWVLSQLGPPPYDAPLIQLVDARTPSEYTNGRIPTAVLQQWQQTLTAELLKPRAALEDIYTGLGLDPSETTVAYCLVGWRASVTWLTLVWLGFEDVRNYDGSWTEWGGGGFPVETGP